MNNNLQQNNVDDVFLDLDNKEKILQKPILNNESIIDRGYDVSGNLENTKGSSIGFFIILGVIVATGVLAIIVMLNY